MMFKIKFMKNQIFFIFCLKLSKEKCQILFQKEHKYFHSLNVMIIIRWF